ncbi:cytochrome (ubi)quinol oxidase subunit III [Sphingomonas bacterium]|uniref:cytochrome (ubi)quinol oxidase subunit III n=1 Tax=Sphingomonas bacterium TaxID=1895847 RepID=UPI0015752DB1|nr:cytochrome (ubi)quinol oxidase subunit III [Sphingomonas bacterium]
MSAAAAADKAGGGGDPHQLGHGDGHDADQAEGGIAPKRIVTGYGFWLFIVSDIIMFSAFFAAYAVLSRATDGGPTARQLFTLDSVAIETACLLLSTFTCGMAALAADARSLLWTQIALLVTGLLGFAFLMLELSEFAELIAKGAGPQRSAFLSAFFALVGCHGLHVGAAMLWCGTMMAQVWAKGFREDIQRRLLCFTLFWHALDIVWVGVFTIVYLLGARG